MVVKVLLLALLVCVLAVAITGVSALSPIEELMQKENISPQKLKESLDTLSEKLGEKTKSKVCQEQLKGLQSYVEKGAVDLMSNRQAATDALCSISKMCVGEIIRALKKMTVGGEQAMTDMMNQMSGGMTGGMDIEMLGQMYYDIMCRDAKNRIEL